MSESKVTEKIRKLTEKDLSQAGVNILMLNIPTSYQAINDKVFNSREVQMCVEDSWRTTPKRLGRTKIILATVKNHGTKEYTRKIVGVFEYAVAAHDSVRDNKGYLRSHFSGVQPASERWIEKFKDCVIYGLNPRATNPLRYFFAK